MNAIKAITKQRLLQGSTATITNALFKRGFVGQAFTPRFIPAPRLNAPC